jgi:hypothetical protein
MTTYEFDLVLKDVAELTDEAADALFEAGCDDGTPACTNGTAWVHFDREASSLEDAIPSAAGPREKWLEKPAGESFVA